MVKMQKHKIILKFILLLEYMYTHIPNYVQENFCEKLWKINICPHRLQMSVRPFLSCWTKKWNNNKFGIFNIYFPLHQLFKRYKILRYTYIKVLSLLQIVYVAKVEADVCSFMRIVNIVCVCVCVCVILCVYLVSQCYVYKYFCVSECRHLSV
jgi:hypothetical protein